MTVTATAATGISLLDVIAYGSFALAALGVAFAVYQLRMGFKQAEDSKQIGQITKTTLESLVPLSEKTDTTLRGLDRVMQELSTRIMGEWPQVLSEIALFVRGTERYLKVLVDVPSYGIFSNFKGHREYVQALEDCLTAGHAVDTIFIAPTGRRKLNETFASDEARAWDTAFASRVDAWIAQAQAYDPTLRSPASFGEFLDLLEYTNQHAIRSLTIAAEMGGDRVGRKLFSHRETESLVPLYIWVRDGVEAVFAVAVLSPGIDQEVAFLTRDRGLVAALEAAFDRYVKEDGASSQDLAPPWPRVLQE